MESNQVPVYETPASPVPTPLMTFLKAALWLVLGALLASTSLYLYQDWSKREQEAAAINAAFLRDTLKGAPIRVAANAIGTSERAISADDTNGNPIQLPQASAQTPLIFVTAQFEYAVDADGAAGLVVTTDAFRKIATITVPSPRFTKIIDQDTVTLASSASSEGDLNPIKNEAVALLQRRAVSAHSIEAAKALVAEHLSATVRAFGYTPQIIWNEAAPQDNRKTPI